MKIKLTVENYRSFVSPGRLDLTLDRGIQSFVGPNNSGKSNILRFFYEFRDVFRIISTGYLLAAPLRYPQEVKDKSEVFGNSNQRDILITLQVLPLQSPTDQRVITIAERPFDLETVTRLRIIVGRESGSYTVEFATDRKVEFSASTSLEFNTGGVPPYIGHTSVPDTDTPAEAFDFCHIVEAGRRLHDTLYIGPYRNLINVGGQSGYFDIDIGDKFIAQWTAAYSGPNRSLNLAAQKLLDEVQQLFGYSSLVLTSSAGILQTYVDKQPFRLDEHGSGIAQFIMVIFAAERKKPTYLLIDEPELHLHPKLQLSFLTALASRAQFGTLFATHSLGLARSASERIFSVKRSPGNPSVLRDYNGLRDLKEILGELSYAGNYDLGYTAVLLIEGPTEYKTFQEILRKYGADQQVTMLCLGGSTLINGDAAGPLSEIKRLSDRIFAMVDSDRVGRDLPAKDSVRAFERVCKEQGIPILVYERRTIENYFTDPAVSAVQRLPALGPYEVVPSGWSKPLNWRVAREMPKEHFDETDVGRFIQNNLLSVASAADAFQKTLGHDGTHSG
jgi:hypothetical protein